MKTMRAYLGISFLAAGLLGAAAHVTAAADADHRLTQDQVIGRLNQTLAWYREARVAIRALGAVFTRDDEQAALALLRRAFETAKLQAAVLKVADASTTQPRPAQSDSNAAKRAELNAAIQTDLQQIEQLRRQVRTATAARRAVLNDKLAAATNRLELDRTRLEFLTKLEESKVVASGTDADLLHQIQALQESVPELGSTNTPAPAPAAVVTAGNTWGLVHRLIEIQHTRSSLESLTKSTKALEQAIGSERRATEASVTPIMTELRELTVDPSPGGSLADGQRTFRELLERGKQLGAVLLSQRDEAALVHRFAADLDTWGSELDRDQWQILQSLGVGLIGVVIALAAILVGGLLWRVAVGRYVSDAYRRRLLLVARNVVVVAAITIVLIFHFASELTVLVTGLGFAAAGIAFALQNVILALVGYFSMVAPNGIRVGDRVSLQGPFGYVQGEVLDIGLVRIRLRELDGDPLRSTGRIVVFPNSVVFTGSFFKLPPPGDRVERPRSVGESADRGRVA
jgi:Mechanosensitive ion channel